MLFEAGSGLLDGQPKDEATVTRALEGMDEMLDLIAAGLYSLASMLVGEGEDSVRLVETAVATAEISACDDAKQGRQNSRRALVYGGASRFWTAHAGLSGGAEGVAHVSVHRGRRS